MNKDHILDNIKDNEPSSSEVEHYGVSKATLRNWKKLKTRSAGRLTTRANKRRSKNRVLPLEYFSNDNNITFVQNMLEYIDDNKIDIVSAIFSLGIGLLSRAGILEKQHVLNALNEYTHIDILDELVEVDLPDDEFDILGLLYQSYLYEGEKNTIGSYYTPQKIVRNMVKKFDFNKEELFFDPCCGSGAFLLSIDSNNPNQIFGVDNDKTAVLISKINLLLKYHELEFVPQVYCLDYLMGYSFMQPHPIFEKKFDYIATNPPWGAIDNNCINQNAIVSKETFSSFFINAYAQLKDNGIIRFLFPESILNVKAHTDIRKFIVDSTKLVSITLYNDMFSGVTTKYIDIESSKAAREDRFELYSNNQRRLIDIKTVYETKNLVFNLLSEDDISIIKAVRRRGQFSLENSIWALGIVTGDNKGKLFPEYRAGMEKIYTGKEIQPYYLLPAKNYILYNRDNLQQVAKEEIYRAPEKLVYKFISNRLVFAYDDSKSLFLNSANILIPNIPSMTTKTVMAFLNSSLYQYIYLKLFGEVKILKGNLIELPFPKITIEENKKLTSLVDEVLYGNTSVQKAIDEYIFLIFNLTDEQIMHVRRTVHGKTN